MFKSLTNVVTDVSKVVAKGTETMTMSLETSLEESIDEHIQALETLSTSQDQRDSMYERVFGRTRSKPTPNPKSKKAK